MLCISKLPFAPLAIMTIVMGISPILVLVTFTTRTQKETWRMLEHSCGLVITFEQRGCRHVVNC